MTHNPAAKKHIEGLIRDRTDDEVRTFLRQFVATLQPPRQLTWLLTNAISVLQGMGFKIIIGEQGESVEYQVDETHPAVLKIRGAAEIQIAALWSGREFDVSEAYEELATSVLLARAEAADLIERNERTDKRAEDLGQEEALASMDIGAGEDSPAPEVVSL